MTSSWKRQRQLRHARMLMLCSLLMMLMMAWPATPLIAESIDPLTDGQEDSLLQARADTETRVSDELSEQAVPEEPESLSADAVSAAPDASDAAQAEAAPAAVSYRVHVQTYGDQAWRADGAAAGTTGQAKRLEALWLRLGPGAPAAGGVQYRTHVQGIGWQGWREDGQESGTHGQSRRLEAVQVRLTGDIARTHDVWYRVHAQTYGWMGWARDGQTAGTAGLSKRLEAIQVVLVAKGAQAPGDVASISSATTITNVCKPAMSYRAHVQGIGWQQWCLDGQTAGTTGQGRRVEALQAQLDSDNISGDLFYCTHVQGIGWTEWSSNGGESGTTGQARRVEALSMRLTGDLERYFDVWYRVHVQSYGWMGWACNGAEAGTQGMSRRVEAIEARILAKGSAAPGSTSNAFRKDARPNMVLIGDSRTLGTYQALYGERVLDYEAVERRDGHGDWWVARNGGAFNWLNNYGISRADPHVNGATAVVILLGVNDCIRWRGPDDPMLGGSDTDHYAQLINARAAEWTRRGAVVYYATVGPVGAGPGDNLFVGPGGHSTTNALIRRWNDEMCSKLSTDVRVLDVYGALASGYRTVDNLHYDDATYRFMYDYVRASVT